MDRFLSMQAFVSVAEARSFAEAARRLGVARSVVSERVRQLEDLLRAPLLHRTTRVVRLSEIGEALLPRYQELVHRLDDLENVRDRARGGLAGRLRLVSVVDFGTTFLAPALARFVEGHPDLSLEFVVDNHVVNPIAEGYDIAFHLRQNRLPGVIQRNLLAIESLYCAAPNYLKGRPPIRKPRDLLRHECINYHGQPNINEWSFIRDGMTERVSVPWRITSNSGQIIREYALAGLGVAVLPLMRVKADLAAGRLQPLLGDWSAPALTLTAAFPRAHEQTRKVQVLLDFLATALAHEHKAERDRAAPKSGSARKQGD